MYRLVIRPAALDLRSGMLNLRPWLFSGLRGKRDDYERYLQSHPDEQLFDGVELTLG